MLTATQIITIIGFIFASNGFWAYLTNRSQKKSVNLDQIQRDLEVQKKSNKALLHDRLFEVCLLCIEQEYVTTEELDNIEYMFKPYEELGGNGMVRKLVKDVRKLPVRELRKENEND